MWLRYSELSDAQRNQARARFLDAGTMRDNYWYEVGGASGTLICRNRNPEESLDDEMIDDADQT